MSLTDNSYGCETWSVILSEEHRLRVLENRVLRKIREGVGVRQNTTVLYPICYADDDMFRPLWAIFR